MKGFKTEGNCPWMAQLRVLRSGHDLTVCEFNPTSGSLLSAWSLLGSSVSLSAPPKFTLSNKPVIIKQKLKKKKRLRARKDFLIQQTRMVLVGG